MEGTHRRVCTSANLKDRHTGECTISANMEDRHTQRRVHISASMEGRHT